MSVLDSGGQAEFLQDVLQALASPQKYLPGKYLWDERGSALFDAICQSASYYPAHRETALLSQCAAEIAASIGPGATIVEMGSGASHKVRILLDAFAHPRRYVAIDISREFLEAAAARIQSAYPKVEVVQVCADYMVPLPPLPVSDSGERLGFFPGISIGNMDEQCAVGILTRLRQALGKGWLLIGQDLNADIARFKQAYASDLMAQFHKNLLVRLVNELGAAISIDDFRHEIRLFEDPPRIEAHLVADIPTDVLIGTHRFSFSAQESIRTDMSRKYTQAAFGKLFAQSGWETIRSWTDADHVFGLYLLQAAA